MGNESHDIRKCVCAECCASRIAHLNQGLGGRLRRGIREARAKEVKRTCLNCGHTRLLPKALANEKAPGKLDLLSARMTATGKEMSLISFTRSSARMKVLAMEDKKARVLTQSQCPACGSIKHRDVAA
jgi:predicted nucleic-acid-binding Zn-ribbon protein